MSNNLNANQVAAIIDRLIDKKTERGMNRTYKRGIVSAVNSQSADVYIEGNEVATQGIPSLGSYRPIVGDKVLLLSIGQTGANTLILGSLEQGLNQWNEPTLINGWTNYSGSFSPAGYTKEGNGIVRLRGLLKDGTVNSGTSGSIFILPEGYRPADTEIFAVATNDSTANSGWVYVYSDGSVLAVRGSSSWFSISGVTFQATQ